MRTASGREIKVREDSMPFCAFCGKMRAEVKRIIDGPTVGICNECIELLASMIGIERSPQGPAQPADGVSNEEPSGQQAFQRPASPRRSDSGEDQSAHYLRAVEEREGLIAALENLVADVLEYERINNLAPNPGRRDCWQSVTNARAILSRAQAP